MEISIVIRKNVDAKNTDKLICEQKWPFIKKILYKILTDTCGKTGKNSKRKRTDGKMQLKFKSEK